VGLTQSACLTSRCRHRRQRPGLVVPWRRLWRPLGRPLREARVTPRRRVPRPAVPVSSRRCGTAVRPRPVQAPEL